MKTAPNLMKVSEFSRMTSRYANSVMDKMDDFDNEHPYPEKWSNLTGEEKANAEKIYNSFRHPPREEMIRRLEEIAAQVFSRYYIVIPD